MVHKKVVLHIGPLSSRGGMSRVMDLLINNSPQGWDSIVMDTYLNSNKIKKIFNVIKLRNKLKEQIVDFSPDLIHIHVTHNFSWWRKLILINLAIKKKIPVVINIHSGKFDIYCQSLFGLPGKKLKSLSKNDLVSVVVLEKRWLVKISKYSSNLCSIRNPVKLTNNISKNKQFGHLKLLLIARGDSIKGHEFAVEIMNLISEKGFNVRLTMTGINDSSKYAEDDRITTYGWLENHEEVKNLIIESDFVLSPSNYEGSSMSVLESMALGTIPIVSKASAETVSLDELVIDTMDVLDWAEAIINIETKSKQNMIKDAIKKVVVKHDVSQVSENWRIKYNSIINNTK